MIELWQFRLSMYPEIVGWALEHKALAYRKHELLPGPHVLQLLPRFGQKTVPVLRDGEQLFKQTIDILQYLEARYPQRPLLPESPKARSAVWEIAHRFCDEFGPAVRLASFHDLLPHGRYMAQVWAAPASPLVRAAYVASFPWLVRPVMRADMGITPARAEQARQQTGLALDYIAERIRDCNYLVGDRFTLADLAAAAVLFPVCLPAQHPARFPQPYPDGVLRWLDRWRDHPATAWVLRMYGLHRQLS